MATEKRRIVCVTGAGGFVGSWLVRVLLSKNYVVHGTVRNPLDDEKNGHLKKLEKACENLKLFKADLLNYESLREAITGCDGVFHTASPVTPNSIPDPEVQLIQPAVVGTLNVLKACCEANVMKVLYVSSVSAVAAVPRPHDRPVDETFWSDQQFCRSVNDWYSLSKTKAESEAWEFSKTNGIDFLSVCPTLVVGPMLQKTMNSSSLSLIKLLKEGYKEVDKRLRFIVDVRDLAEALILVYEKPEANGRYICTSHQIRLDELVAIFNKHYPHYNNLNKFMESTETTSITSRKLQELGWSYRSLEETIVDSVEFYAQNGLLSKE